MSRYLLILLLVILSCVSSQFIPGSTVKYEPYGGVVAILYQFPKEEYEIIGTVVVRGEDASLSMVLAELQRKSAEIGGNAVIVQQNQNLSSSGVAMPLATGGFIMGSSEIKEVVGTAIKMKTESDNSKKNIKKNITTKRFMDIWELNNEITQEILIIAEDKTYIKKMIQQKDGKIGFSYFEYGTFELKGREITFNPIDCSKLKNKLLGGECLINKYSFQIIENKYLILIHTDDDGKVTSEKYTKKLM